MTRIAVVGAGGYVGGRLVAHLRGRGTPTVAIARHSPPWLGDPLASVDLLADPPGALDAAVDGCDVLVHVAGHDEVRFAAEPEASLHETISMTQRVADAATRLGAGRVVYLSTVHVYGAQLRPGAVITEGVVPEPRAAYALARLTSEHLLAGALAGGPGLVVLRLTNSVGAPVHPAVDRWTLLVNDLVLQLLRTGEVGLRTPGLQWRDFVDLGDVCQAIAAAAGTGVPPGTYNLGSGQAATVREVADLVAARGEALLGVPATVVAPSADGPGDEPYHVDVGRLAALGVRADTPTVRSIDEVLQFCADHRGDLAEAR